VAVRTVPATRARVAAVPTWAWLTGIVVLAAASLYVIGRQIVAPWILTDELIYSSLSRSFAATGEFLIRGAHYRHIGPVYPVLISPAYAIFDSIPHAYAAIKVINAVLMALTAVPAYFLGRRVLSTRFALIGALLAVAIPSILYSGTVMTENAFYPVFVATALAFVLALERPTIQRTLVLFALCVLAFFVRAQAIVLLPAIVTAPFLMAAFRRNLRTLREYWPLFALVAVLVVPALLVQVARGRPLSGLFGRYSFVGHLHYSVWPVLKWFVYHLAELDLYAGVLPFAALVLMIVTARRLTPAGQALVAGTAALTVWPALEVGAFVAAQPWLDRIQDRNTFFVVPLLLIVLLMWIERGLQRPRPAVVIAVVVACALPAVLPLESLLRTAVVSDALGLIPWWEMVTSGSCRAGMGSRCRFCSSSTSSAPACSPGGSSRDSRSARSAPPSSARQTTGSTAPSRRAQRFRSSGAGRQTRSGSGRTSSSTGAPGPSTRSTGGCRETCRRSPRPSAPMAGCWSPESR
jgi:Dolichyl-phosphate-mannose-protein mannosyltransferase